MNALAEVLIAALAALWGWMNLNDDTGIFGFIPRAAERVGGLREKGLKCPWCSGAWLAIAATLLLRSAGDPIGYTIVAAFAAAAVTGLLGSYFGEG